jgi:hypothetical protein
LVLAFLLAATPQLLLNTGSKSARSSPSIEKATASYNSPAYQEALKALGDGAVRDVRIIEGSE